MGRAAVGAVRSSSRSGLKATAKLADFSLVLAPGIYFRLLVASYFEGLDSERGMVWRAADSLALREFLGLKLSESPPDHSTISRTRRLIDVETHEAVFSWVFKQPAESGLLKGKTIGIDATTGRIAGTPLCPSLRDGWDETESPSRWRKPLEAVADSRQCLQPGSTDAPAARRRDAQGSSEGRLRALAFMLRWLLRAKRGLRGLIYDPFEGSFHFFPKGAFVSY